MSTIDCIVFILYTTDGETNYFSLGQIKKKFGDLIENAVCYFAEGV